jgi:nickel-dependent lactate racemase
MMPNDYPTVLPTEFCNRYKVVSHKSDDVDNLVYLGETLRGTPVWSNKAYVQSDLKIVVGNIEPHQIAGFSGGVKTAAIGLAGIDTITTNHALLTDPNSRIGVYESNPLRQDVEEIGGLIGIDLVLNAVLNHHKDIVQVFAGEPCAVMGAGIPLSRQLSQVSVPGLYRLMIVSPGGHPKDINVYQAQKGLAHAAHVTQPGGTLILAAACPEGSGSHHYQDWMVGKRSYEQVLHQFDEEGFRIGPHKAYLVARDASKIKLMTFSKLDDKLSRELLLNPVEDFQVAIDKASGNLRHGDRVGIMPYAVSTIPTIKR